MRSYMQGLDSPASAFSLPQPQIASPFAATVQRALTGALSFDGREVPLTKLTKQLSLNLAESRARGPPKQTAKPGGQHTGSAPSTQTGGVVNALLCLGRLLARCCCCTMTVSHMQPAMVNGTPSKPLQKARNADGTARCRAPCTCERCYSKLRATDGDTEGKLCIVASCIPCNAELTLQ